MEKDQEAFGDALSLKVPSALAVGVFIFWSVIG
jgi:hypothetical protein